MSKKVTIITVAYNAGALIEQTIQSVIHQDYLDIEYIIIDGASTDNTVEIINKYITAISYLVSEPDAGIYDAMNKGIELATGEWIVFMNTGDSFVNQKIISKVMQDINHDTDLFSGGIYYIEGLQKTYKQPKGLSYLFHGMPCYHQTLFTKSDLLKSEKFDTQFKVAGDYDFVMRCAVKNKIFQFVNYPIANFIAEGISEQKSILARIEDLFIQTRYLEDSQTVFSSAAYTALASYDKELNNYKFAYLVNHFYRWLNTLDTDKDYLLYGFGRVAKMICNEDKISIVGAIDQNEQIAQLSMNLPIQPVNTIHNFIFDYVIITALGREQEIIKLLVEHNVTREKILTIELGR